MPKNISATKIKLPKNLGALDRKTKDFLAKEVIDYLILRTRKGHGKNDRPWNKARARKYSKEYPKTPPVNLTVTGDLMKAIKHLNTSGRQLHIGVPFSDENYGKAKGNILGSYGKRPDSKKARNFLEFGRTDLQKVIKKAGKKLEKLYAQGIDLDAI